MKSMQPKERERLLSHWQRAASDGDPIGCIATSFTFDAPFFEEECLTRFVGMETSPQEDPHGYIVEREERLSQVGVAVMVDRRHVVRARSLRWNLLPVSVPRGGVFHPKLTLLVWEHRVRLMVGSCNLTEPGYRANYEHLGVLDFTPAGDTPLSVLQDTLEFLEQCRALASGDPNAAQGPQPVVRTFLEQVRRQTQSWNDPAWKRGDPTVRLFAVLPRTKSLLEQIQAVAWNGPGPTEATILSPFYDGADRVRATVDALVAVMGVQGERSIHFHAPGRALPSGVMQIDLPGALREGGHRRVVHQFSVVRERDAQGELRPLHAKSLWLERGERAVFVIGSSNFTGPGLGIPGGPINVEINLVYTLPDSAGAFSRDCAAAYPPADEVDPAHAKVEFQEPPSQTADPEGFHLLPQAFGAALFTPDADRGSLQLEIGADAPPAFEVSEDGAGIILAEGTWAAQGRPAEVVLDWNERRPPSGLVVGWVTKGGESRKAIWVVNVTDAARLPAPDELRLLTLDQLIDVLTSARPLHEAVAEALRAAAHTEDLGSDARAGDALARHSGNAFLLRRMRRVAAALEGLRQRLQRPAYNLDALRWRLHGPVGPINLARQLATAEGRGAAFMVAEVARTVASVDWGLVGHQLGAAAVKAEVVTVIEGLRQLVHGASDPPPPALVAYVEETFEELLR